MSSIVDDVTSGLARYGNAVLLLPTPRWEKQVAAHVQAFWLEAMIPLIHVASLVETSVSTRSRRRRNGPSLSELVGRPDSAGFASRWLDAMNSGLVGESNVFIALDESSFRSSIVLQRTQSVGYFDGARKRFSHSAQTAIERCLSAANLALGVGPPPFGSAYVFVRLS